jgi:hypothetical protein
MKDRFTTKDKHISDLQDKAGNLKSMSVALKILYHKPAPGRSSGFQVSCRSAGTILSILKHKPGARRSSTCTGSYSVQDQARKLAATSIVQQEAYS